MNNLNQLYRSLSIVSICCFTIPASCQNSPIVPLKNEFSLSHVTAKTILSLFNCNLIETETRLSKFHFNYAGKDVNLNQNRFNSKYFLRINKNDTDVIILQAYPDLKEIERIFVGIHNTNAYKTLLVELSSTKYKLLKKKETPFDTSYLYSINYKLGESWYIMATIRSVNKSKLLTLDFLNEKQFDLVRNLIFPDSLLNVYDYLKFKQSIGGTKKNPGTSSWQNEVYRNKYYNFRIQFPKNWQYDNGTARHTLARAYDEKKVAAISISVTPISDKLDYPNDIFNSSVPINKMEEFMNQVMALQNSKIENFHIQKGYLNNFPAYIYEFTSIQRQGTKEINYFSKQAQCYYNNHIYQLNLNIPIELYDPEMASTFKNVLNSFTFEITN